jgi:hypothetical protein
MFFVCIRVDTVVITGCESKNHPIVIVSLLQKGIRSNRSVTMHVVP